MSDSELFLLINSIKMFFEKAEKLNGRIAMLGIVATVGAYVLTGQIIPGVL